MPEIGSYARRHPRSPEASDVMADTVSILDGNTFVVSDRRGDIEAAPATTTVCSATTRASCRAGS